jgi:hypothetical protein
MHGYTEEKQTMDALYEVEGYTKSQRISLQLIKLICGLLIKCDKRFGMYMERFFFIYCWHLSPSHYIVSSLFITFKCDVLLLYIYIYTDTQIYYTNIQ